MKNKKRLMLILAFLALNLAIMACHIPLVSQSVGAGEMTSESSKVTDIAPTDVEETATATSTPSQTSSTDPGMTQVYSGDGVEIRLPGTYIVGDSQEIETLLEEGDLLNDEYGKSIELMFENLKQDILLWGYDTDPTDQGETGLIVIKNEQFGGMSLMLISSFIRPMIGSQLDVIEQGRLTINDRDTLRLITQSANDSFEGYQVLYIFNAEGKLWVIGFFTNSQLEQSRLEIFYDAVESFRIIEGE